MIQSYGKTLAVRRPSRGRPVASDLLRMRTTFSLAGRTLSYLVAGEPARGTLVLLHAFPLSAAMWEPQLSGLPAGWRIVAPDFRGFGASDPPAAGAAGDRPLADYAGDVLALLDHLGADDPVVAGLSMGGYVAFDVARRAIHRLRGLVLADTRAQADSDEARAGREKMLADLDEGGPARVADLMVPRLLGETTRRANPDLVKRVREMAVANPPRGIRDALVWMMARPDSTPLLPRLACPTLVLGGDEDTVTGEGELRYMRERIPGADLAIVPRAGHLANLENPDAFNGTLARFLAAHFETR